MSKFFTLQLTEKRGFTLIELMIAVSIVGILSTVGMVMYSSSQKVARDSKRKQDLRSIAQALEIFYLEYKRYPCSDAGGTGVNSNTGNWLTDSNVANCISTGVTGTNTSLAPSYMNSVPKDPLSPSTTYQYSYLSSGNNTLGTQPCGNKDFILWAVLENTNDPDRTGATPSRVICGNINVNTYFGSNAYVIKMP
jgi:prepilin-type N-terminal cleavage/methylation domain-containing protein